MKTFAFILIFLLSSCSTATLLKATKIKDETNSFVQYTYKKAQAVNLERLDKKSILDGSKEIRIWIGFGLVSPEHLLVLNINKYGMISGKKVLIYNRDPDNWKDKEDSLEEFLESLYSYCDVIGTFNYIESCGVLHNEIYDWSKIYEKLNQLNVWTLPDESALPKPEIMILDGLSIIVELREGNSYRAYSYGNPGFRKDNEAVDASNIMLFVMGL